MTLSEGVIVTHVHNPDSNPDRSPVGTKIEVFNMNYLVVPGSPTKGQLKGANETAQIIRFLRKEVPRQPSPFAKGR